jgi:hypothetical protein
VLRGPPGRRGRAGKCLLKKTDADPGHAADRPQRGRRPWPSPHHLGKQRQADANDLAAFGQAGDRLVEKSPLLPCRRTRRQSAQGPPQRAQHLPGVPRVQKVDQRAVLPFPQGDLQFAEKPADGQPEVVADKDQALDRLAVALPQGLDQFGPPLAPVGVQPLLELIEHEEHLPALRFGPITGRG